MKQLHKPEFFGWSAFQEAQNIDFHSFLWRRDKGNILFDPLPMSGHDRQHLESLGGAEYIIVTNSDHIRDAVNLAAHFSAQIWGPVGENNNFPIPCSHWLKQGDKKIPGLEVFEMDGSKTAGELAVIINETTLVTGDLIRSHEGGRLCLLPDMKLKNKNLAIQSVKQFASRSKIDAVLTGDGWPVFRDGAKILDELFASL